MLNSEGREALAQLPRESVGASSLEVLGAGLDGAMGSLSWWGGRGWGRVIFKVPSSLSHSMNVLLLKLEKSNEMV